jgi:hypothetical protein
MNEPDARAALAVVVGRDPDAVRDVARAAAAAGARTAVFVGDPSDDRDRAALVELITELA